MLKLDKQHRITLPKELRLLAKFQIPCKVYCIYKDAETVLLKSSPDWGVDRVVDATSIDEKGRLFITRSLRKLFEIDDAVAFLVWGEPDVIHISKIESD